MEGNRFKPKTEPKRKAIKAIEKAVLGNDPCKTGGQ